MFVEQPLASPGSANNIYHLWKKKKNISSSLQKITLRWHFLDILHSKNEIDMLPHTAKWVLDHRNIEVLVFWIHLTAKTVIWSFAFLGQCSNEWRHELWSPACNDQQLYEENDQKEHEEDEQKRTNYQKEHGEEDQKEQIIKRNMERMIKKNKFHGEDDQKEQIFKRTTKRKTNKNKLSKGTWRGWPIKTNYEKEHGEDDHKEQIMKRNTKKK